VFGLLVFPQLSQTQRRFCFFCFHDRFLQGGCVFCRLHFATEIRFLNPHVQKPRPFGVVGCFCNCSLPCRVCAACCCCCCLLLLAAAAAAACCCSSSLLLLLPPTPHTTMRYSIPPPPLIAHSPPLLHPKTPSSPPPPPPNKMVNLTCQYFGDDGPCFTRPTYGVPGAQTPKLHTDFVC